MRWGVVQFPGSCDERDAVYALGAVIGDEVELLWHGDADTKGVDAILLPGGFSYGDYLRCGAMARFSPVMRAITEHASAGGPVLGASANGVEVRTDTGQVLTLVHDPDPAGAVGLVSADAVSARTIDPDTGNITVTNVYAQ